MSTNILDAIRSISKVEVEAVLDEWDQIGREKFLDRYGTNPARKYFVRRSGRRYDAMPVVVAALRSKAGGPGIDISDIRGDSKHIRDPLVDLGVEVISAEQMTHLRSLIEQVLELQPKYEKRHSPEMERRGQLLLEIGKELSEYIRTSNVANNCEVGTCFRRKRSLIKVSELRLNHSRDDARSMVEAAIEINGTYESFNDIAGVAWGVSGKGTLKELTEALIGYEVLGLGAGKFSRLGQREDGNPKNRISEKLQTAESAYRGIERDFSKQSVGKRIAELGFSPRKVDSVRCLA